MNKGNGIVATLTLAAMLATSLPAGAGIVGTEHMVAREARAVALGRIGNVLAGEAVAARLEAWGVAPEAVSARLAALSDVELQRLATSMESDPAGGDGVLVVVGVVFVVLIILEMVGVTNIFRRV
jgi:hypothetical protein